MLYNPQMILEKLANKDSPSKVQVNTRNSLKQLNNFNYFDEQPRPEVKQCQHCHVINDIDKICSHQPLYYNTVILGQSCAK